ncbi:hypothetical protein HYS84_00600 [Candidatus Saccharibacteria bacterium]|nr:hypothetical protein [Candidatus Saccharibacteria bacterium]
MNEFEAKSLCILGRQPALGLAELESLYGAEHVKPLANAALLDTPAGEINFKKLGGTLKVAQLLSVLPSSNWESAYEYLAENIPKHLQNQRGGKFTLGVSVYGLDLSVKKLNTDLLSLKKIIRSQGRPARIVPNKTLQLNTAQVLYNNLTKRGAWELLVLRHGRQTYLAQTFFVQDIEAYAARDQVRPKRDARVGMLPPKLAQILINLSSPENRKQKTVNSKPRPIRILDPFAGTGVILQEALLMGYHVVGTDIEPRMVEYSKVNIQWLFKKYPRIEGHVVIEQGDATNYQWPRFSAVASEVYLGRPLNSLPPSDKLKEIVNDVNTIIKKFLQNLAPQLRAGQKVALAVPAWRNVKGRTFHRLPLLDAFDGATRRSASTLSKKVEWVDNLTSLGYNRVDFVHVKNDELVYFREDQIVARELLILEKR